MNMLQLTLRYMKIQKKRTVLTIIGIILAIALVSGTGILISSFLNMRLLQAEKDNGTWHYHVSGIADYKKAETLLSNALIDKAGLAAYDFYAQIDKSSGQKDKYSYFSLAEYDSAALSMMPYTLTEGRMPKNRGEIVLGSNLSDLGYKIGDKIDCPIGKFQMSGKSTAFIKTGARTFTVVGIYDCSNSFILSSGSNITTSVTSNIYNAISLNPTGTHLYSVYAQMKPNVDFPSSISKAVRDCGIGTDGINENGIVEWMGKSAETKVKTTVLTTFLILALIILAAMVLVIRNSFAMSVAEKISQIGTLRCLGASPAHIRNLVLSEAIIIWLISLPIGFAGGVAAMAVVIAAVDNIDPTEFSFLHLTVPFWPFILTTLLSLAAVILSAVSPIRNAMKMSMVEAVRGNGTYSGKNIRKNSKGKILGGIFGFPGMLAAKNIRRNPRQFRTTLLSIIVSVVLFISVGGFSMSVSASVNNAANSFGGMDYEFTGDTGIKGVAQGLDSIEKGIKKLKTVSAVQRTAVYSVSAQIPFSRVPDNFNSVCKEFTNSDAVDAGSKNLVRDLEVVEVSRENYASLKFSGKAPTYDELLKSKGALLYQTQTFVSSGGRMATVDFSNYKTGDTIDLTQYYGKESAKSRNLKVKITGVLSETPWFASKAQGYLIVAKGNTGMFDASTLKGENKTLDSQNISLEIKYAKGYEEQADTQMGQFTSATRKYGVGCDSIYEQTNSTRKQFLIMAIFVYGFTAIIILISCVNIFNTIHANLLNRKREIAMTRAVGMGQRQLIRMLLLECALYGAIGTVWGSIIGVPLAMLLLKSFGHIIMADIQSPFLYVLISLIASVGIGILAGFSTIRKTLKASIIEEIRTSCT